MSKKIVKVGSGKLNVPKKKVLKTVHDVNWYIDNPEGIEMVLGGEVEYPIVIYGGYKGAPEIPKHRYAIDIFRAALTRNLDLAIRMLDLGIVEPDMNTVYACCEVLHTDEKGQQLEDILDVLESVFGTKDDWFDIPDPDNKAPQCFNILMQGKHFGNSVRVQEVCEGLIVQHGVDVNRAVLGEGNILVSLIKWYPTQLTLGKFKFLMRHGINLEVETSTFIQPRKTLLDQLTFGVDLDVYIEILLYLSRNVRK